MAKILGASKLEVLGSLHCLWWWGLDNAPEGFVAEDDVELLGAAAEWTGEALGYAQALIAAGFLDQVEGGYTLHDWPDYAGKLIDRRQRNAEQMRRARAEHKGITKEPRVSHVLNTSTTRDDTCKATGPNPTGPSLFTNVNSGGGTSHEAAPGGANSSPLPLRERYANLLASEKNKAAQIGALMEELYGTRYPPDFARIGGFVKVAGRWGPVLDVVVNAYGLWDGTDDPHDLIHKCLVNGKKNGRAGDASKGNPYLSDEEWEEKRKRDAEWERSYGVQR